MIEPLMETLFNRGPLATILDKNRQEAVDHVQKIPREQFSCSMDDVVLAHVMSKLQHEPLCLHRQLFTWDIDDGRISGWDGSSVSGVRARVTLPFTGDFQLWYYLPNTHRSVIPRAQVQTDGFPSGAGALVIIVEVPDDRAERDLAGEIKSVIDNIEYHVDQVRGQIERHNEVLQRDVRRAITARRKKLALYSTVAKTIDIPLERKEGAPTFHPLEVRRKPVVPLSNSPKGQEERGLTDEAYEDILSILRHMGRTLESLPSAPSKLDEEELRDFLLASLNAVYKGQATGETFRRNGKTDILITAENREAFVGECKVWYGPKTVGDAINQMLGYHTWRDCRSALIAFNKHYAGFSTIQKNLPELLMKHPNFVSDLGTKQPGEWRLRFKLADDPGRFVAVHVFLFDLYVKPNKKKMGREKDES